MSSRSIPGSKVRDLVLRLFCGDSAPYGEYVDIADEGEVLIADTLFRFTLRAADKQIFTLQLFFRINTLGGALWTREVRALLRASSRQHPALPGILAGAYVEEEDLAFVITRAAMNQLSELGQMGLIKSNRVEALRQLTILGQGLSLLHEQGIVHRNLHPGSVECIADRASPGRFTLRLCRFEMSAMISNLVRRGLAFESLYGKDLRGLYLGSDDADETLPYCPPERAEWLFGDGKVHPENDRADVFALGVLAWRWLIETTGDHEAWPAPERSRAGVLRFHRHMRRVLHERRGVPAKLRDLLLKMLDEVPATRPRMHDVMTVLIANFGAFAASLAPQAKTRTYFVGFMPVESRKTIYRWGWIDQDPSTPTGREQLREFLRDELQGAELVYRPEGFTAYHEARDEQEKKALAAARYVLAGKMAYWFCDIYDQPWQTTSLEDRRVEELLLIKYVVSRQRASRLHTATLSRRVPEQLELVPVWPDQRIDVKEIRETGESWRPLLKSVEHEQPVPKWMQLMEDALRFLLDYQQAVLDAQVFPYQVVEPAGGEAPGMVTLTLDVQRGRKYEFEGALRSLYISELRTPMGRLFEGLDSERSASFAVFADKNGRPDFKAGFVAKLLFQARRDDNTVQLRALHDRRGLPAQGWIRPDEDFGDQLQLQRQRAAVEELLGAQTLLEQLHAPVAIRGIRARWAGVGDHLAGRSADIVKDMLGCEPFYALHGPPGSGKTTVTAVAVAAALKVDPSQRILVSSQSHYALDNLGIRVMKLCKAAATPADEEPAEARPESRDPLDGIVAVRIASEHALASNKIHPVMKRRLPEKLAAEAVDGIKRACEEALASGHIPHGPPLNDALRDVLVEWKELAPRVELELRDRIRRGANLVFATTGACTDERVTAAGVDGMYDWVIVEEAARAWPTELALPLVRGLRWTLVGDHFQLPAFDDLSVQRFLELCRKSGKEDLTRHGERAAEYRAVFRMFGNLFDGRARRRKERPRTMRLIEPLDELDMQFRMHKDICRVVSRAFYRERIDPDTGAPKHYVDGWLQTHPSANRRHDQHAPSVLGPRSLVWFDTTGVPDCTDQRAWYNPGEIEVIQRLLERLRPVPPAGDESFAILTPYNAQREALLRASLPGWVDSRIYTIDSFQGREADIVVVSLVRSVQRHPQRPEANIGHLVSPNRVNVLLSRARQLLIIVGRLDHFLEQAQLDHDRVELRFWQTVVGEFRALDAVVSAKAVLGGEETW